MIINALVSQATMYTSVVMQDVITGSDTMAQSCSQAVKL